MTTRVAALFVTALFGVLGMVGLVLAQLGGVVLATYVGVVLLGLALLVRQARALRARQEAVRNDGRTCSCCTTTVFDPIEIR